MASLVITRGLILARMAELAAIAPEKTRDDLSGQIEACKWLASKGQPVFQRLNEIAKVDPARTKGSSFCQKQAEEMLRQLTAAVKVDKNQEI